LQGRLLRSAFDAFRIVADVAAKLATLIVANQEVEDAAFGLGLECQLSSGLLQQRAEKCGQGQRLRKQLLDNRRIAVIGKDRVDHRPQPRDAAAGIAGGDRDAERDVRFKLYCRHDG